MLRIISRKARDAQFPIRFDVDPFELIYFGFDTDL